MRAVVVRRFGGPEVLRVQRLPEPVAGAGESLIDVTMAGLNYDDVERRNGDCQPQALPVVLGVDVVGRRRGDGRRVAALLRQGGGYAEVVAAKDAYTVEIPAGIDDEQAAGLFEQGGCAYGALLLAGRLREGESVAVSAAAGGVGHLAVQLAIAFGASPVIGIASTPAKREFVRKLGADVVLDPAEGNLADRLRDASGGGVDLFVDSVGGALTRDALHGLAAFGRLVCVGWRDGGIISTTTAELTERSIGCAGFWMRHVVDNRPLLCQTVETLFQLVRQGRLAARIDRVVSLDEVGQAHALMASRATMGKILIDVGRDH
jgi:NADPH2:quinone reductase